MNYYWTPQLLIAAAVFIFVLGLVQDLFGLPWWVFPVLGIILMAVQLFLQKFKGRSW